MTSKDWCICFEHYDPEDEGRREALLALGNGYLMSRAAAPESTDDDIHYPGTYRVGCYNRLTSHIQDKEVENESLVNLPNWLSLTFRINESHWFSLNDVEILDYRQVLDMKQAILHRKVHFRDKQGRQTMLQERRFVSMEHPHLMGLEVKLTAENWSGELEVYSAIDGRILNNNVQRYALYNKRHLETVATKQLGKDGIALQARTRQSGIEIAFAARTQLHIPGRAAHVKRGVDYEADRIADRLHMSVEKGERIVIEKTATLYTSRDFAISECSGAARLSLKRAKDFDTLFAGHCCWWEQLWQRCRLEVDNMDQLRYFRLHMFHILQNMSPHTADQDVGIPPSGWQGEEYHGQVFWDELFIFPFLAFRFPAIARTSLLYRYRRLNEARHMARQYGYRGAMFPWRSGSSGQEETPLFQLNLYSSRWMQDHTRLQHHVGAAIAYNIWQYVQITGDQVFLSDYGAEVFLEIARFWASIAHYNAEQDRYEIHGVVGPDEYHTQYPNAATPGINNNTYTNIMAVWTLSLARQVFDHLPPQRRQELWDMLTLSSEELDHWDTVSRKMRIVFQNEGILSQFEGFDRLQRFDLHQFRAQHGHQRIDWTLEAMGDSVERYQVSKQADTSSLLYLFSPEELTALLERLGYSIDQDTLRRTVDYHIAHTAHDSSLSLVGYAGALAALDLEASWEFFQKAQLIDTSPQEGKDTSEGIHLGAMGGTLAVLQHHYLGLKVQPDVLEVHPALPKAIGRVCMTLYFRGVEIECEAIHTNLTLRSVHRNTASVKVSCAGHTKELKPGMPVTFSLTA